MGDTAAGNLYGISETVKILSLYAVVLVLPLLLPRASADSNLREVSVHTRMANANRNPRLLQRESLWVSEAAVDGNGKLEKKEMLTDIRIVIMLHESINNSNRLYATFNETITIDKRSRVMPRIRIQIEAEFENISTMQMENVLVHNKFRPGLRIIPEPNPLPMVNDYQFIWNFSDVQNISMDYTAEPNRGARDTFFTDFTIIESSNNLPNKTKTQIGMLYCLEMKKRIDRKWLHEFTALIFFLGIFLGITLLIFIMLLIVIHRQRSITPYSKEYTKHKSLMMTASKWDDKQMDVGSSGNHDSIVEVLGKSPITTFREINGWDISSTQFLEKQVEIMRCEAYTKIPVDLVHKMIERQEVSPQAGYKIIREFRCKTEEFIQNLNKQFQIAKQEVHREITLRNKAEIEKLHTERRNAMEALQKKQGSREEMIKIQKEYEDKEKDLVIQLELKQEHDMYSLNREFDLKKRKGLKDLEEELLNLVREESSLLLEKYEWLKEESERKQAEFQKIIENIATYENAVLEERHQKHQAMFEISNNQEVDYRYLLNKAVANQKGILQKLKQDKIITDDESDQFCTELHQELRRIKDEFSEKRFAKEKELHAELSLEKKRILEDLENKHNREIADLEAKFKQQNDLDELSRMIELKRTKSNQRIELMKTEISLDEKHVQALNELREKTSQESIAEFEKALENMIRSMEKPECEDVVDGYINNYRQDIQNLERKQQEERKEYTIKVNEKLSQKQKESLEQNEEEKESLEKMNENRIEVIEELLKIQDSMSDENRKKILEEHEMQKMRFEKSLTLNKLRQQSLLEEKLAMKRKQKLDNQEKQQALAAKSGDTNTESGDANGVNENSATTDADFYTPEIDEINLSSEIEEINRSLLKQREKAKQEQEEKLGETIARLNLEKAKQMCLLEEKARAIDSMKTMLMEDMRVNGDAESQKIIEEHTKKQQILQQQSEEKKKKFDEELTKKLEVRKLQRETTLTEKHEKEIRDVLCKAPNKTAAIIKKVVLMNKHILERERFINQMNVQLKQNIEELSQQSDIKIQTDLQKNEVKLILSLLAMNKIKREVIFSAMKIPVELKNLINEIQNSENGSDPPEERNSALETKIHDFVVKSTESEKTNDEDNKK